MSLDGNKQETVRQPRSIAVKFATWFGLYTVIIAILSAVTGIGVFSSPRDLIYPSLVAGIYAYFTRPESQRVTFKSQDQFVETVKKTVPKNYRLTVQTQTMLYFEPSSEFGKLFNDVILIEIREDTASITGESMVVNRLRQELVKTGVASLT